MDKNIFIIIFIIIFVSVVNYYNNRNIEHFVNIKANKENNYYNENYANLQSIVFSEDTIYKNDIKEILKRAIVNKNDPKTTTVLDAGVGTGKHYEYLSSIVKNVVGVDKSDAMIKYAKIRNPSGDFIKGDITEDNLFKSETFDCIICLVDTLYHNRIKDQLKILKNFKKWLKDGGVLCIHVFDRTKLDPAPRNYSQYYNDKNGVKHAQTYFDNFVHDSFWLDKNPKDIRYVEKISFFKGNNKGKDKTQVHRFYFPAKVKIIQNIVNSGFKLYDIVDLKNVDVDSHDIHFFISQ